MISGWGRSLGEGNGNPLQYFCLGNLTDRGAWRATVHGVTKSQTRLRDRARIWEDRAYLTKECAKIHTPIPPGDVPKRERGPNAVIH